MRNNKDMKDHVRVGLLLAACRPFHVTNEFYNILCFMISYRWFLKEAF